MPEWRVHDKWALRMGVPLNVSRYVNKFIDDPKRCKEYIEFLKCRFREEGIMLVDDEEYERYEAISFCIRVSDMIGHDSGRRSKHDLHLQLEFLETKGLEYVRAYYLHHALDYIATVYPALTLDEIFTKLDRKIGDHYKENIRREWLNVKNFIKNNIKEIIEDLK